LAGRGALLVTEPVSPFPVLQPNGVDGALINGAAGVNPTQEFSDSLRGS